MAQKSLKELRPNPKNPRTITDKKTKMLRDSLARFGDLSGIVVNKATGNQVVGGHQRLKAFAELGASDVIIERQYDAPTRAGTVAEGYVYIEGERYAYREVEWTHKAEELAANIAANAQAGQWDLPELAEMLTEMQDFNIDLDLTMFAENERAMLAFDRRAIAGNDSNVSAERFSDGPESETVSEMGKAVGQDKDSEIDIASFDAIGLECPRCGFHFRDKDVKKHDT